MISIKNLSHEYNKGLKNSVITLKNINLNIEKGSFISIIGNNASGKSTLAKHLNGLIIPQKGSIIIDGQIIKDNENIWNIRQKVGMIFQNPDNQFIGGTIEEDIAFGLENIGIKSENMDKIIYYCAKKVGMINFLKMPPHKLSGGQKQRSAIASVLAMKPEYLVLDEPTSMLDPQGRKEIQDIILELNKKDGMTIILITHYIDEILFSDKIVLMYKGEKFIEGKPREIFKKNSSILKTGMKLPKILELSLTLKEKGLDLDDVILTKEELVENLCRLK